MSSAGSNPAVPDDRKPPRQVPAGPDPSRYATGQLLALALVALVALPLLPLIALVVVWVRYRNRRGARPRVGPR